jgi:uncharacterized protein YdaU (DUF1376 family)
MPVELTRFDFHVVRFFESNDVESMTDREIGQYVLLLCKSFLSGKAASLPDDPKYLAKWARCRKVSPKVMAKFPLVDTEWGPRRRNETMYGEWLVAMERSASASERGKRGGLANKVISDENVQINYKNDNSSVISSHSEAMASARAPAIVEANNQSNQSIKPNQTYQTNMTGKFSQGNFKNIRAHWYRHFRKDVAPTKRNRDQYAEACSLYGEDQVLAYLEVWAASNPWVAAHPKGENRLYVFLAALPAMVSGDMMRSNSEVEQLAESRTSQEAIAAIIAADDEANRRKREEAERRHRQEQEEEARSAGVMF